MNLKTKKILTSIFLLVIISIIISFIISFLFKINYRNILETIAAILLSLSLIVILLGPRRGFLRLVFGDDKNEKKIDSNFYMIIFSVSALVLFFVPVIFKI